MVCDFWNSYFLVTLRVDKNQQKFVTIWIWIVYKKGSQKIKSFLFLRKIHRRFKILVVLFFSTIPHINYRDLANLVLKLHFFNH